MPGYEERKKSRKIPVPDAEQKNLSALWKHVQGNGLCFLSHAFSEAAGTQISAAELFKKAGLKLRGLWGCLAGKLGFSHFDQLLCHISADIAVLSGRKITLIHLFVVCQSELVGDFCFHAVERRLGLRVNLVL